MTSHEINETIAFDEAGLRGLNHFPPSFMRLACQRSSQTEYFPWMANLRIAVLPFADDVKSFTRPEQRINTPREGWPSTNKTVPLGW
jgi:hypothetical protein